MRAHHTAWLLAPILVGACATTPRRHTLAELQDVEPELSELRVEDSLDQAMRSYRHFLEETPESQLTPEAMRRLADLKLEKEFGILGHGEIQELPAPETMNAAGSASHGPPAANVTAPMESAQDFERRASAGEKIALTVDDFDVELPGGEEVAWSGPREAIALYDEILTRYPNYEHNDQVLYQKARAFDELGRSEEAIATIERLIAQYPASAYIDEVQFRRAEYFFVRKRYPEAEDAYSAVTRMGDTSEYFELALYKLGWTLYKQEFHEEALHQYVTLLDYKVSTGYDFEQSHDEDDERRVADTYRVISLCLSNLGGAKAVEDYFAANGHRSYEQHIYSHFGEFYLAKLRYHDAAGVYQTFVALNPLHRASPHFSMRVVEIYEAGGFPILVLESKKEFAASYGLQSSYWRHFDVAETPEVLAYLKSNLRDLANHYHALYQQGEFEEEKPANFEEALRWYRAYLASFPEDPETPATHYQLADLLLEHRGFGDAALEYERIAYDYPAHARSAEAGYAAIYAHRENEKAAGDAQREAFRRDAVASTLRFVDTFPDHEHAAVVLGAAVDDLYEMKEFELAIARGRSLIDGYRAAKPSIRRDAWAVVAHSLFDTTRYVQAEQAYEQVIEMTPVDDESRKAVVDNLAAAIYKQGEQANLAEDYRTAADHFLRVKQAAPSSEIRPAAEYDAGAALIRLEDWAGAAAVLESFRRDHPDHALHREATVQIAFVYREAGNSARAAGEYERVAAEADDSELQREALLVAGELHEESEKLDRALDVYLRYVDQFPEPLETAVETRFKIAGIYAATHDAASRRAQLQKIVETDAAAESARTERVRYLAAQSALILSEDLYHRFDEVALVQPFERSLAEKKRRMDAALEAFGRLVNYEVGDVTAAATFYMAEVYLDFSRALIDSERPAALSAAELQDYEMALEEEAFPFEERAIAVHEKNLELMNAGVYNAWIERSLGKLADLMPGRYAKFEASSGFIDSLDSFAYRTPSAPASGTGEAPVGEPAEAEESTPPVGFNSDQTG